MAENVVLRCPAVSQLHPEVRGLEVVDQQWHLSIEEHRDILVDVTGIDPTEELDLQDLAIITARLEGYVSARKQSTERSHRAPDVVEDARSERKFGISSLLSKLLSFIPWHSSGSADEPDRTPGNEHSSGEEYDTEQVYQLSRFFRAMLDDRRTEIIESSGRPPETVSAK